MPLSDVVLDASALYPTILCDTLLRAAEASLYRPRWSDDILRELLDNLASRIGRARAERRVALMRLSFPTAAVIGHHGLIAGLTNHRKDRPSWPRPSGRTPTRS